ncbi:hypothetical protein DPMN_079503 [Dreissena polymorpha]|uniref:Uncharacterized protein n=1 Tax=Dreissena polymorpha TaxID=45954 RepID=A0A9D4BT14_DREPO|nr:hypothetical protein DPMN_079503 [Dreissena polymorpha]
MPYAARIAPDKPAYPRSMVRSYPSGTHFAVVEKQDHSGQGVIRSAVAKKLDNEGQGETNYENYDVELFENDDRVTKNIFTQWLSLRRRGCLNGHHSANGP